MYEYAGKVVKVVDGDTFDVIVDLGFKIKQEIRVRLKDIDTPEIYHPSCPEELAHGQAAKKFVEEKLLDKEILLVTFKDKTGKYGRYLADVVYVDENYAAHFIIDELKKAGLEKKERYK